MSCGAISVSGREYWTLFPAGHGKVYDLEDSYFVIRH
jgi:hypothetical protein